MTLVCPDCFDQKGLQRRISDIRPLYNEGECDFHPRKKGVPIDAVAVVLDEVIRNNYYPSVDIDMFGNQNEGTFREFLYDLTGADDDAVVNALSNSLIENDDYYPPDGGNPFYDDDYSYHPTESIDEQHSTRWRHFCNRIVHEQRFFNAQAQKSLEQIFDGLHLLRSADGSKAVYKLDNQNGNIFRARIANDPQMQKKISDDTVKELGPPPKRLRSPGRMNSSGIRTFYGAFDLQTCVSELRPAVGEVIIAAEFSIRKPILVLDTTKFSSGPKRQDIFTKTHNKRLSLWAFMARFMSEIAQPCLPNDEHLDYIPTQVVAEYLVHLHKFNIGAKDHTIDAIIFQSAQNPGGKNIAIFGDAGGIYKEPSADSPSFHRRSRANSALELVPNSLKVKKVDSVQHGVDEYYGSSWSDDLSF